MKRTFLALMLLTVFACAAYGDTISLNLGWNGGGSAGFTLSNRGDPAQGLYPQFISGGASNYINGSWYYFDFQSGHLVGTPTWTPYSCLGCSADDGTYTASYGPGGSWTLTTPTLVFTGALTGGTYWYSFATPNGPGHMASASFNAGLVGNAYGDFRMSYHVVTDAWITVTPVPEPGTLLLLGTGLVALWSQRKRLLRQR